MERVLQAIEKAELLPPISEESSKNTFEIGIRLTPE